MSSCPAGTRPTVQTFASNTSTCATKRSFPTSASRQNTLLRAASWMFTALLRSAGSREHRGWPNEVSLVGQNRLRAWTPDQADARASRRSRAPARRRSLDGPRRSRRRGRGALGDALAPRGRATRTGQGGSRVQAGPDGRALGGQVGRADRQGRAARLAGVGVAARTPVSRALGHTTRVAQTDRPERFRLTNGHISA
jgi:hypothetical protein